MKNENQLNGSLARLLATENINVVIDAKMQTAAFDLVNRTLILPNWDNCTKQVQLLLLGHEVGHALYTRTTDWQNALAANPKKGYKQFLNIVEDARIEKKIKRKYPGLRSDFQKGYFELYNSDFFGVKDEDINKLRLIDRVNMHFKIGNLAEVKFSESEMVMVNAVASAETWENVVSATEMLYSYAKDEKQQEQEENQPSKDDDQEESDEDQSDDDQSDYGDDEQEESEDDEQEESEDEQPDQSDGDANNGQDEEQEEQEGDDDDVESITDSAMRKSEKLLASCAQLTVITLPKVDLAQLFVHNKELTDDIEFHNSEVFGNVDNLAILNHSIDEFFKENNGLIDLHVKEFQMKKKASAWKKAKVSDTGDISASKLAYYKLTDQVFKARTVVPNGKNHGMVLLLDMSGSMDANFDSSLTQCLVLATFCKRVGIPYTLLGFTKNTFSTKREGISFSREEGELALEKISLIELLSSNLSSAQYKKALQTILILMQASGMWHFGVKKSIPYPVNTFISTGRVARLGSTPTTEALVALMDFIPNFQKKNRVEILDLVIVTDGEEDGVDCTWVKDPEGFIEKQSIFSYYDDELWRKTCQGKLGYKNQYYTLNNRKDIIPTLLNIMAAEFKVKVFGFFLVPLGKGHRWNQSTTEITTKLGKNKNGFQLSVQVIRFNLNEFKFVESYLPGYIRYFMINPNDDREIQVDAGASNIKIKTAFMKNNKNRKFSRILVSKFMELAA